MATPQKPLTGKVAIVTGGSRGIGRAVATHLRSLGARVVVGYASNSARAEEVVAELGGGSTALAFRADVAEAREVEAMFDHAEEAFGSPVNAVVNCAGIMDPEYPPVADTSEAAWDAAFATNARGAFLTAREAAKRITRGGGGRIVMVTSSVVGSSPAGYGAYVASKAAVEAMTRVLAKELRGTGITANCVAPGPVESELFFAGKTDQALQRFRDACPLGRLGKPADVAQLVGFLVGDAGEWVNGQVLRVNGGFII